MTRRGTTVSTHVTKYSCLMDELVRLSHQAAFHFFSLLFSNEELDQGEREVHGGAGPARGDDLSVLHHARLLVMHPIELRGGERAGEARGAVALQLAGVGEHARRGADRGGVFAVLAQDAQQMM